jgi:hypothetical protein
MRAMLLGVKPQDPTNLVVTVQPPPPPAPTSRAVKLTWTDNSTTETGFTVERSTDAGASWTKSFNVPAMPGSGGTITFFDTTVQARRTYWYRVTANNIVGYTKTYAGPGVIGYPWQAYNSNPTAVSAPVTTNSAGGIGIFSLGTLSPFIFASNFENGTTGWTETVGKVLVTPAAALGPNSGQSGMAAVFGPASEDLVTLAIPQPAYVRDGSLNHETSYDASFQFSPNGSDSGSSPVDIFTTLDQAGQPAFGIQYQVDPSQESGYQVRGWVMQAGVQAFTPWAPISNAAHYLEVAWMSGTSAGFSLYVDEYLMSTLTGNTSSQTLTQSLLGPSNGLSLTTAGTLYFDDFSSSRLNGIQYNVFVPSVRQ